MFRKISIIVACSALTVFLAGAAQAKQMVRIDQRIAGASVITLDETGGGVADGTAEGKGAPGKSSYRVLAEFGPPGPASPRCAGFDFELSVPSGSAVTTFADFSQLYAIIDSGYSCGSFDGARRTVYETSIVGGTGRFEGATGTATAELEGVALGATNSPRAEP